MTQAGMNPKSSRVPGQLATFFALLAAACGPQNDTRQPSAPRAEPVSAPQPTPQPAASDEAPASAVPAVFDAQLLQGSWQVGPGRGDQPEWFRSGSPELAAALAPAGGNIMTSSYSISQNRDTASAAAGTATKVSRGPIDAPEHRSGGYVISGNRLSLHWSLRDGQTIDETEVLELREPAAANRFAWRSVQ